MKQKKKWSELTPKQRTLVVVVGAVQLTLNVLVQRDVGRRAAGEIRGSKTMWRLAAFVQPVGPIAYFLIGRKRQDSPAG